MTIVLNPLNAVKDFFSSRFLPDYNMWQIRIELHIKSPLGLIGFYWVFIEHTK